jgi:hypothetical protein
MLRWSWLRRGLARTALAKTIGVKAETEESIILVLARNGHAHEMHAYEMHAHEMHAYEMYAHQVHAH